MLTRPPRIIHVLRQFETVCSERVWEWARVLVIGAILAPGERTVAAILRVVGCSDEQQFQNDHRVLNRATWSSREMPVCMILPLSGKSENAVERRSKAKRTPSWLRASTIPRRSGRLTACPGMQGQRARWRLPLAQLCGINRLSLRSRSVGYSFAIQRASMSQCLAVHRSRGSGCSDRAVVCLALDRGSHLSRGTCSFGRGDPTPVVGCGDLAHDSCLAGSVFARHHFCSSVVGRSSVSGSPDGLVFQSFAHLFRYACLRTPASVARRLFFGVAQRRRHGSHSTGPFRALRGDARFCCLTRTICLKHLDKVYLQKKRLIKADFCPHCCRKDRYWVSIGTVIICSEKRA